MCCWAHSIARPGQRLANSADMRIAALANVMVFLSAQALKTPASLPAEDQPRSRVDGLSSSSRGALCIKTDQHILVGAIWISSSRSKSHRQLAVGPGLPLRKARAHRKVDRCPASRDTLSDSRTG